MLLCVFYGFVTFGIYGIYGIYGITLLWFTLFMAKNTAHTITVLFLSRNSDDTYKHNI